MATPRCKISITPAERGQCWQKISTTHYKWHSTLPLWCLWRALASVVNHWCKKALSEKTNPVDFWTQIILVMNSNLWTAYKRGLLHKQQHLGTVERPNYEQTTFYLCRFQSLRSRTNMVSECLRVSMLWFHWSPFPSVWHFCDDRLSQKILPLLLKLSSWELLNIYVEVPPRGCNQVRAPLH